MKYCIHCKQEVQPKKKFRVGLFIGLFSLGFTIMGIFGFMIASTYMPFASMGYSYSELESVRNTWAGIGTFLFFLFWVPYLIHYAAQKPEICPICNGNEYDDYHGLTEAEITELEEKERKLKYERIRYNRETVIGAIIVLLGLVVAFSAVSMIVVITYGSIVGVIVPIIIITLLLYKHRKKYKHTPDKHDLAGI